jgi:Zn finger protein HypA/HybF involved in hydrogenase expression
MSYSNGRAPYWLNGGWTVHDLGVVSEEAVRFLAEVDGRWVDEVTLEVGPGMELEVAQASWAHVVVGTIGAEARVRWERVNDTLLCFACSTTYDGEKLDVCPACGSNGLVIEHAPEFTVRSWRGAD